MHFQYNLLRKLQISDMLKVNEIDHKSLRTFVIVSYLQIILFRIHDIATEVKSDFAIQMTVEQVLAKKFELKG